MSHYLTISKAITYIAAQPHQVSELEDIAKHVWLSPSYFQKVFTEWCGISPKQFSRYLTLSYAKWLLAEEKKSNLTTSILTGLSGTGRLHDLFVDIEAMTPGEYKNDGENLIISYSFQSSQFGSYLVASTSKGICNILFFEDKDLAIKDLKERWKHAKFIENTTNIQEQVIDFFENKTPPSKIKLHLHGTNFQLKVWEALLSIPEGKITSYGAIAHQIGDANLSRAVGTAIGDNPIWYLIPCHRVLKSTGDISGYRWWVDRKRMILGWEAHMSNVHDAV
jgi:AraC family transcriptional regulator of adaptative response/methylated-DNA-[protein]-cysteine methyltransferase